MVFLLSQDEDGYPPVDAEGVWCTRTDRGAYELDNIPFFTREATLGDVVRVREVDGELRFDGTISESGNSLLRVAVMNADVAELRKELAALGCSTEASEQYGLVAVNVPTSTSLVRVQEFLAVGADGGRWDYEEPILRQP